MREKKIKKYFIVHKNIKERKIKIINCLVKYRSSETITHACYSGKVTAFKSTLNRNPHYVKLSSSLHWVIRKEKKMLFVIVIHVLVCQEEGTSSLECSRKKRF